RDQRAAADGGERDVDLGLLERTERRVAPPVDEPFAGLPHAHRAEHELARVPARAPGLVDPAADARLDVDRRVRPPARLAVLPPAAPPAVDLGGATRRPPRPRAGP